MSVTGCVRISKSVSLKDLSFIGKGRHFAILPQTKSTTQSIDATVYVVLHRVYPDQAYNYYIQR